MDPLGVLKLNDLKNEWKTPLVSHICGISLTLPSSDLISCSFGKPENGRASRRVKSHHEVLQQGFYRIVTLGMLWIQTPIPASIFVNTTPLHKQIVTGRTICETLSCFFQAMSINSALAGGSFPWTNALHLANGDLDANSYVSNSALAAVARAVAKKKKGVALEMEGFCLVCFWWSFRWMWHRNPNLNPFLKAKGICWQKIKWFSDSYEGSQDFWNAYGLASSAFAYSMSIVVPSFQLNLSNHHTLTCESSMNSCRLSESASNSPQAPCLKGEIYQHH